MSRCFVGICVSLWYIPNFSPLWASFSHQLRLQSSVPGGGIRCPVVVLRIFQVVFMIYKQKKLKLATVFANVRYMFLKSLLEFKLLNGVCCMQSTKYLAQIFCKQFFHYFVEKFDLDKEACGRLVEIYVRRQDRLRGGLPKMASAI